MHGNAAGGEVPGGTRGPTRALGHSATATDAKGAERSPVIDRLTEGAPKPPG
ncbi:hypothetical protein ACIBKZ_10995 [Streptomyces sp. NPDC050421]|uniref:hypothetical protein n=1 Tax=Streptomyces sp. NPDC050421 TaxID=3365613 RepID=UPI00378D1F55